MQFGNVWLTLGLDLIKPKWPLYGTVTVHVIVSQVSSCLQTGQPDISTLSSAFTSISHTCMADLCPDRATCPLKTLGRLQHFLDRGRNNELDQPACPQLRTQALQPVFYLLPSPRTSVHAVPHTQCHLIKFWATRHFLTSALSSHLFYF